MKSPFLGPFRAAVNGYRRDTLIADRKKGDFREFFLADAQTNMSSKTVSRS